MAEEHEKCPDCGTPLMDLERRLEVTDADASHRHHAVDCVVALKERVKALESRLDASVERLRERADREAAMGRRMAVSGVVVVTDEMLRGPPIDIPSIVRAGGFEEGVRVERARVVAWLRSAPLTGPAETVYADAIEKGTHAEPATR